ncbi:LacI family transcriptional regulator [Rhodoferax lacus]|uniref:LacI family transcriptional regulator n=1 Tax=Rhodoferax lacus TaxID=2184758 RepID=A0A3E1RC49_9BURK|nr:substrate-binding domain-containing protein [Rhodoferax lacus]RFO96210.1 LacI family transcriptional regulator [Rhodoferax lacus]
MNIKALAKELGLSTSTVSRALNGYQDVNEQTRLRVEAAAKALGYRANAGARRLVRGSTEAIGIVYSAAVENLGNPQFLDMAGGLSERLHSEHFDLMLAVASDEMDLDIYDRLFRGGRVDAVVLPNTRVEDARVNYLLEKGYPFLAYGRTGNCSGYSWFDFDNDAGSRLAVRHLAALGHRRIAYVHSPLLLNFAWQRHRGFLAGLQEAGLSFDPACLAGPAVDRRSGREAVQALMALNQPPTAIVVDNNLGGIGVMRGLMDRGLRLGKDISVVVHGVIPADSLLAGLDATMVTQPTAHSTGVTMADMVLQVLREPAAGPFQMLRQPELVVGQTTGPAA